MDIVCSTTLSERRIYPQQQLIIIMVMHDEKEQGPENARLKIRDQIPETKNA